VSGKPDYHTSHRTSTAPRVQRVARTAGTFSYVALVDKARQSCLALLPAAHCPVANYQRTLVVGCLHHVAKMAGTCLVAPPGMPCSTAGFDIVSFCVSAPESF
jgi:hypothetical protein